MSAGDPRFFRRTGPHSIARIAELARGIVAAAGRPVEAALLSGIAPLQSAGPDDVSFLDNKQYVGALEQTRAGAVLLRADMQSRLHAAGVAIVCANPYAAWARVAALFHPPSVTLPGIHPRAVVAPDARIDPTAAIGPLARIGAGASVGPRCDIAPGAVIGDGVLLGADCRIGAHASISHALLGARIYVYPGAHIGQSALGHDPGVPWSAREAPGRVVIGDDVEIGANSTVDRGCLRDTVIGAGSRLDNLAYVAADAEIGRCCVVVAHAAIHAGATVDDFVMIGGQAQVGPALHIGQKAQIAAQAGIETDVPSAVSFAGSPATPAREAFRYIAFMRRLTQHRD